ncbi:pyridoxal phosphate-dependent aminotransferase [Microaceticoccus formicicus]|uniref:pyridoxal phosphate-dependent aminotransferase n=1 Tax=Microaceticoccus formicicus TaxID=3118105 RepID=UPI003CD02C74|nr:pyridoxal phosphate-dependent aminotransferase [Peptoniphilaceae bacterium AMB_02]
MISKKMASFLGKSSLIRAMFEEGKKLKAEYGSDNVYDFSLGNPNVPAPIEVNRAIIDLIENEDPVLLHGYMSNQGFEDVREVVANSLNKKHGTSFTSNNILMTVGAAAGLNIIFKTLLDPGDEVIVLKPYFLEYGNYVRNYDGVLVEVDTLKDSFMPDYDALKSAINDKTKAVIINSPHNPTGVVYSEDTIVKIAEVLRAKESELNKTIYLISDEPYRELVYDGVEVPYLTKYYDDTIVAYSYSKSLSLPGERIGYLVIPDEASCSEDIMGAATIANRIMGFVNAPSLIQRVIGKCIDAAVDLDFYDVNRKLLYNRLKELGLECVLPQGAFYLFVKSPIEDERIFIEMGKQHNILMVPGSAFSAPGYVRLAYCVSKACIENSLPAFASLMEDVKNLR